MPVLSDQRTDVGIGLRVGRALAEDDERLRRTLQQIHRALHRLRRGNLARGRIHDLDERVLAGDRVHRLRKELRRQVEVHAARTAGHGGTDRPRDAHADVLGMQDAERGLAQRLGDRELVHFLVVALLQVDDLALRGAADEDHRKAVDRRVRERSHAVEEAGRGHGQADAGLPGEEACDRRGVSGVLFVPERDHAQAVLLHAAREVGDRNAGQTEDRIDAVQLEGIDDELKAVGFLRLAIDLAAGSARRDFGGRRRGFRNGFGGDVVHGFLRNRHWEWLRAGSTSGLPGPVRRGTPGVDSSRFCKYIA